MRATDLKPYGLSSVEAKTYLAALELGEASVDRIAKKARLNRSSIYHTLSILKQKGLVSSAKRAKRTVYVAEDPRKLKYKMQENLNAFDILLPELRSITNVIDRKPKIKFYEGYDELLEAVNDSLQYPDSELLFWFADVAPSQEYTDYWYQTYQPSRVKAGMPARAIGPACEMGYEMVQSDKKNLRRTRIDQSETFKPTSIILVYGGEKVAIISHKDMIALVIESREINLMMRSIFESHWSSLEAN